MPKLFVTVNRGVIDHNRKHKDTKPPIRVVRGRYGKPTYHHTFKFDGKGKFIYSPNKPMPHGARLWLELEVD